MLTLLDSNTGDVISRHQVEGKKWPGGVTTDSADNVYVCYLRTREVAVLTRDLSEEKILLTVPLSNPPPAIVYNIVAVVFVVIHDIVD